MQNGNYNNYIIHWNIQSVKERYSLKDDVVTGIEMGMVRWK